MLVAVDARRHVDEDAGSGARASTSPRSRSARQNAAGMGCANIAAQLRASAPFTQPATTLATAGMRQRKLQRGGLQRHGEFRAQLFEATHSFEYRGGRGGIVVMGLRAGARARRENSGVERSAADDGDTAFNAQRQQRLQRRLFQQGVAPGEQDAVELALSEQLDADFPFVDAEADGAHRATLAQLAHGAIAAVEKFAHARLVTARRA